jgi:hypothetical protein
MPTYKSLPAPGAPSARPAGITEAVQSRDASLATAQRLLLRELGTLEDETTTRQLVEEIASTRAPAPVLVITDARAAIATRHNGLRRSCSPRSVATTVTCR